MVFLLDSIKKAPTGTNSTKIQAAQLSYWNLLELGEMKLRKL